MLLTMLLKACPEDSRYEVFKRVKNRHVKMWGKEGKGICSIRVLLILGAYGIVGKVGVGRIALTCQILASGADVQFAILDLIHVAHSVGNESAYLSSYLPAVAEAVGFAESLFPASAVKSAD